MLVTCRKKMEQFEAIFHFNDSQLEVTQVLLLVREILTFAHFYHIKIMNAPQNKSEIQLFTKVHFPSEYYVDVNRRSSKEKYLILNIFFLSFEK